MKLDEILEMWKTDCVIPQGKYDDVSRDTPALHAKYLELLSIAKLEVRVAEMKQKNLLKDKWLYYNGKMSQDEIENLGWDFDPFNGLKVLKGEMNYYYDSDIDIQKSEQLVQYKKVMVETLTDIVDSLKWRHQTISNIIKWKVFEAGG